MGKPVHPEQTAAWKLFSVQHTTRTAGFELITFGIADGVANINFLLSKKHGWEIFSNVDEIQPNVDQIHMIYSRVWMRSIAEWLERLTVNTKVTTALGSIPASSDTLEYERRQMNKVYLRIFYKKLPLLEF
jgi:hypothetical protein